MLCVTPVTEVYVDGSGPVGQQVIGSVSSSKLLKDRLPEISCCLYSTADTLLPLEYHSLSFPPKRCQVEVLRENSNVYHLRVVSLDMLLYKLLAVDE